MAEKSRQNRTCTYWSDTGKRCTSTIDGLFIPDERYIIAYCATPRFIDCARYCRELQLQKKEALDGTNNRRRHARTLIHYPVVLRYMNRIRETIRRSSSTADTIDFSDGGLQVASRKPLFTNTLVRVIYSGPAPSACHEDLVLVRWCHYHENTSHYRAGLSFHSQLSGKNRRLYSGLPQARTRNPPFPH